VSASERGWGACGARRFPLCYTRAMRRYRHNNIERARELRRQPTDAERDLWAELRGKRLAGMRWRRQQPFGPYILDFYCASKKVAIELDGDSHIGKSAYDKDRDEYLEERGVFVLHLYNSDLRNDPLGVFEAIYLACERRADG